MSITTSIKTIVQAAALGAVLAFIVGGTFARADDCDDEQDEIKKLVERVINNNDSPKGVGPVCSATGQILGITKAAREVAAECYDDGDKRTQILAAYDKAVKEMEEKIDGVCK
jgi:uncharacterized membrane protein